MNLSVYGSKAVLMQSINDVVNLILKGFGLRSYQVKNPDGFIPVVQKGDDTNNYNFTEIVEAIRNKNKDKVFQYCSDHGVDALFEVSSQSKDSILHWACLTGDVDMLHLLKDIYNKNTKEIALTWQELINMKNHLEQTPLHWSCTIENLSLIYFLKNEGADLNAIDNKGVTPLIMCCQYGNISVATYLILNGVNIFACDKEGDNALHWALYKGYPELARLMISSGLNPNQKDAFGQTPLHFACLSGNGNCVQNLVEIDNVEINVFDNNHKTPLMLAAGRRQGKIVEFLKFSITCRTSGESFFSKLKAKCFGTPFNSYFPMIFFILSAMLWGNPYYFFVIKPCSINYAYFSNFVFIFVQCLMWIFFILASVKDAGFIMKNDSHYSKIMNGSNIMENFKNIKIKDCHSPINKICHSCKSYKPIRSRHCKTCDRCINEMDHHCPYVGNCIGKNNRHWFLLFIIFMDTAIVIVSYLFYIAFSFQKLSFYPAAATCILISIGLILGFTILFFMFKQAVVNLTLIETQKWRKYNYLQNGDGSFHNPFNKGYVKNLLLFFNMKKNDVLQ